MNKQIYNFVRIFGKFKHTRKNSFHQKPIFDPKKSHFLCLSALKIKKIVLYCFSKFCIIC